MPAPPISSQPEYLHKRTLAVADAAGHVGLDRRLGEREEVRAEADPALLAVERAHHVQERALEIGERQTAVDREPLELVEDGEVRGVDRVAPVAAADRDHVDRRLTRLQLVDLRGRGLGAEQHVAFEEERLALRARRMRRREVELVEVVVRRLDLAVVADVIAEAEEGVLDPPAVQRRRVSVPRFSSSPGSVTSTTSSRRARSRSARSSSLRAPRPPPRPPRVPGSAPAPTRGRAPRGGPTFSSLFRPR